MHNRPLPPQVYYFDTSTKRIATLTKEQIYDMPYNQWQKIFSNLLVTQDGNYPEAGATSEQITRSYKENLLVTQKNFIARKHGHAVGNNRPLLPINIHHLFANLTNNQANQQHAAVRPKTR